MEMFCLEPNSVSTHSIDTFPGHTSPMMTGPFEIPAPPGPESDTTPSADVCFCDNPDLSSTTCQRPFCFDPCEESCGS